ncbi:MAG: molybdopterin-dependent oxidoreductase, partial [bacterium]|nr:molybdopterin-dependent oxidoreductase [bacterium]
LVRPAMSKMFVVAQEIYRHAPNNLYADVIFPAATWGESGGVYVQSERRLYVVDKAAEPPKNCKPDLDIVIDKGREIGHLLGLDVDKIFPFKKLPNGFYDVEEVFRAILKTSKGTDADISGILEVEQETGKSPYQQLRELRGIQWPAPFAEIAKKGGYKRRFLGQEEGWTDKPYGAFRTGDGKAHMNLCEQDYSQREEILAELSKCGVDPDFYIIDHLDLLVKARDMGLSPELPDFEYRDTAIEDIPEDKYPYWLNLGVVYEHFHTAKTIRSATNAKLLLEQYVEVHPDDAEALGIEDGDWVRVITRRGSYEARASTGLESDVKPARNEVPPGSLFSPWNLSVADSADPKKNKWLVNSVAHRAFDPVSGQSDYKKLAARLEKI